MKPYDKAIELYDGLRLHQNENTGGCSPRVVAALRALDANQIGFYPPYAAATATCARHFGVDPKEIILTNGLDEGIMALAITRLRPTAGAPPPEAVVPEPAFDVYRLDAEVAGATVVSVAPTPDFLLPLHEVLRAITANTRVVFIANPNNPTGVSTPAETVSEIARRVPPEAIVFLDEAYAEFAGHSFISRLPSHPNVVIGRTFSKAYGLAGLRIGCLIGAASTLEPIRPAIPLYNVNVAAITAVTAAIADRDHLQRYLDQVRQSKQLFYEACDRLGLKYWPSDANFVLVNAGALTGALVEGLARRGVFVKDRSSEPGCAGCIRIVTGMVAHTRRCIDAIEQVLAVRGNI